MYHTGKEPAVSNIGKCLNSYSHVSDQKVDIIKIGCTVNEMKIEEIIRLISLKVKDTGMSIRKKIIICLGWALLMQVFKLKEKFGFIEFEIYKYRCINHWYVLCSIQIGVQYFVDIMKNIMGESMKSQSKIYLHFLLLKYYLCISVDTFEQVFSRCYHEIFMQISLSGMQYKTL